MFRLLLLIFCFLGSSAQRWRRSRNRCFFRKAGKKARITASDTQFLVENTFLQVKTTLTVQAVRPWGRGRVKEMVMYYLPKDALVSSLELKLSDGTVYTGFVDTNANAKQFYANNGVNKALIIRRSINAQFATVVLRTQFRRSEMVEISIGWQILLELNFNSYNFYFPIPLAKSTINSKIRVHGSIVEQEPIQMAQIDSPSTGISTTGGPFCTKHLVPDGTGATAPCSDFTTLVNRVDVDFNATYYDFKRWLNRLRRPRLRGWQVLGSSSDSASDSDRRRLNWRAYRLARARAHMRRRRFRSAYQYDLVFAMTYNHSVSTYINPQPFDPNNFIGPIYRGINRQCYIHGVTINRAYDQIFATSNQPAVPLYPDIRRATFFVDDYTNVPLAYWNNIKLGLQTAVEYGGSDRPSEILPVTIQLNDTRTFNRFRIVVMSKNGVLKFPNAGSGFSMPFADPNAVVGGQTALQAALTWISNLPTPLQAPKAKWTFDQTKNQFVATMKEYVDIAVNLPGDTGKSEISDIFYFANMKPPGTRGSFFKTKRNQFIAAVKVEQDRLKAHTTRVYGQPIFTFGFGPDADFQLLSSLSANNWGSTRMAFETTSASNVETQIQQWYKGIGRVIASNLVISDITIRYGPGFAFPPLNQITGSSLSDAGFNIPLLRDLQEYNVAWNVTNVTQSFPGLGTFGVHSFQYNVRFTAAGALGQHSVDVASGNLTSILVDIPQDQLGIASALQSQSNTCRQAAVVRINTFEAALKYGSTKTTAELNTMIEEQGLTGQLQTSQTAFVVADVTALESDSGGSTAPFVAEATNDASLVSLRAVIMVICAAVVIVY